MVLPVMLSPIIHAGIWDPITRIALLMMDTINFVVDAVAMDVGIVVYYLILFIQVDPLQPLLFLGQHVLYSLQLLIAAEEEQ